jgi:hypothetical protein
MVFVETRVGELKPEAYRKAFPDEPEREMDMRVVDTEGRTFFVIKGGDDFADPTWEKDIMDHAKPGQAHLDHRAADYALMEEAADELAKAESAPEFAPHVFHLKSVSGFVPARNDIVKAHLTELNDIKRPEIMLKNTATPYSGADDYNYMYADTTSKSIFLGVANHSATTGRNFGWKTTGTAVLDETWINCNHGTCSNNMSFRHSAESGWIAGYKSLGSFFSRETSTTTGGVWGSCGTGYNWNTPPGHDCNDDSAYQMWQVRYASPGSSTTYGAGGDRWRFHVIDSSGNWFACDCSYTGRCNDWSVPKKPHY